MLPFVSGFCPPGGVCGGSVCSSPRLFCSCFGAFINFVSFSWRRNSTCVWLTTYEGDVDIQRAFAAGARGYMLKNMGPSDLLNMIRQVHAGKRHVPAAVANSLAEHVGDENLTKRETEVLQHLAAGNRNRDIAKRLFISEETVKVHVKHIMEKLGASDRTQALAIAARRGYIQL